MSVGQLPYPEQIQFPPVDVDQVTPSVDDVALRHAGQELTRQMTYRRLLLMISDGEPSDVDIADRRYLVEDARRAVMSLRHVGIDVFCVGLDAGGDNYLTRIFGRHNVVQVDRLERLPEKLPLLYFRLAG